MSSRFKALIEEEKTVLKSIFKIKTLHMTIIINYPLI